MFKKTFEKLHKAAAQSIDDAMAAKLRRDNGTHLSALRRALAFEQEAAELASERAIKSELNLSATVLAYQCGELDLAARLAAAALDNAPAWVSQNIKVLLALINHAKKQTDLSAHAGASRG
jgi:predicted hydrocarbon binding protein